MPYQTPTGIRSQDVFVAAACSLLLVVGTLCNTAFAQAQNEEASDHAASKPALPPTTEDPPGYRALVSEALDEYDAGHFEEARALFQQAHALFPNARTLRGLGMVAFELRNYGECIAHLEAALNSNVRPLDSMLRADAEQLLLRAQRFVARISLRVTPDASTVLVDGVEADLTETSAILLSVGEHVIEIRARSYVPERRVLKITGGEQEALRIELTPEAQAQVDPLLAHGRRFWFGPQLSGIRPIRGYADHALGMGFELSLFLERPTWVLDVRPGVRFDLRPGPDDYFHVPLEVAGYYRLPTTHHSVLLGAGTGLAYIHEETDVTRTIGTVITARTHNTIPETALGVPVFARAAVQLFRSAHASLLISADYTVTFGNFKERTNEQAVRLHVGALFGRLR